MASTTTRATVCAATSSPTSAGPTACAPSTPATIPGAPATSTSRPRPRDGRVLTTQLYFPGEPQNDQDAIFDPLLLVDLTAEADGARARFDFVLET